MSSYSFLTDYISRLPPVVRASYILEPGLRHDSLVTQLQEGGLSVPVELVEFYEFAFGARLGEYKILNLAEMASAIGEMESIYEDRHLPTVIPFGFVLGVGDYLAFDTSRAGEHGLLILDGFHETPPATWHGICFGLRNWLRQMVSSSFTPFWLSPK